MTKQKRTELYEAHTDGKTWWVQTSAPERKVLATGLAESQARLIVRTVNCHDDLLGMTKLLERSLVYEIKKSEREGDEEGANLKAFTLAQVRAVIAGAEEGKS